MITATVVNPQSAVTIKTWNCKMLKSEIYKLFLEKTVHH